MAEQGKNITLQLPVGDSVLVHLVGKAMAKLSDKLIAWFG